MKAIIKFVAASVLILGFVAKADAVLIDFDSLSDWELLSGQYSEATFSSDASTELRIKDISGAFGTSSPNVLCAVPSGTATGNCANTPGSFTVDFTNAVNSLSFMFAADNIVGSIIGKVDIFENFVFSGTVDIIGSELATGEILDLSAFLDVTRIRIHSITDPGGLVYDNFSFSVPEPGTLAIFGIGLFGMGLARRRKV